MELGRARWRHEPAEAALLTSLFELGNEFAAAIVYTFFY